MAKLRRKPSDPAKIMERRAAARRQEDAALRADGVDPKIARWGDEPLDVQRLAALARQGFEVVRAESEAAKNPGRSTVAVDHRGRQVKPSHKADIWQQLLTRGALDRDQLNAVRNLQDIMAKRAGVGGRDEAMAYDRDKTDCSSDLCLVSDRMLMAGVEMDLTLDLVGPPSRRLLTGLLWPSVMCEPCDWREVVQREAPWAKNPMAQSALLVNAAQALLDVRPDVERKLKARTDAKREAKRMADQRADPQALAL